MSDEETLFEAKKPVPPDPVPGPSTAVGAVAFKAPPFWKQNPKLYFAQIESEFVNAKITQDETKYHKLVSVIETDILAQVSDIILNPPSTLKYEKLKNRLIEQFQDTETRQIKLLLQELQLGDDRPSQLLRKMKDLSKEVPGDFLKNLWLQRMPTAVQQILATSTGDLDSLAKMADKIMEVTDSSSVHLVEKKDGCSHCQTIQKQVDELAKQVEDLKTEKRKWRKQSRSPARGRFVRKRSSSRKFDPTAGTCWYHYKYGSNARKCVKPCQHQEN